MHETRRLGLFARRYLSARHWGLAWLFSLNLLVSLRLQSSAFIEMHDLPRLHAHFPPPTTRDVSIDLRRKSHCLRLSSGSWLASASPRPSTHKKTKIDLWHIMPLLLLCSTLSSYKQCFFFLWLGEERSPSQHKQDFYWLSCCVNPPSTLFKLSPRAMHGARGVFV